MMMIILGIFLATGIFMVIYGNILMNRDIKNMTPEERNQMEFEHDREMGKW